MAVRTVDKSEAIHSTAKHLQRIGILIVAYNAVTTLTKVLTRIPKQVWADVAEVVVFDDASQDATYELGIGYKTLSNTANLTIFKNEKNLGYGGNQKAGYQYFIDKGFDAVVLLHGDGQYAPEMLAEMYLPIINGEADAVFGSRMMKDFGGPLKGGMPVYKYLGNRILTVAENAALGMKLTEFHSGYRAYSLNALRQIDFTHMTNDFHFDTEIIIKLHHQGFRIKETPIPTYYGDEICYVNGMKYARDVMRSVYRYKSTVRSTKRYPEYEEYFTHYPLKQSRHSSHDYFERLIGQNQDVLDLGCGEGFFSERVAAKNNRVVGVDMLSEPQKAAFLAEYYRADLSNGLDDVMPALKGRTFDKILLQDIIEHLPHPERILQDCLALLKPGGQLLVSVPNIANITVRMALLFGRFNYTQRGILDKTHVRFFTRSTARRMLEENGYEIIMQKATIMPFELALGIPESSSVAKILNNGLAFTTRVMPGLLGYQLLYNARPKTPYSERQ